MVLAVILTGLGVTIVISAVGSAGDAIGNYGWCGMVFILADPMSFGLTVRGLGFVPSIFFTTLIAALAALKLKPLQAAGLAVGVTIFTTVVFSFVLGLPFRQFGSWLPF